MVLGKHSGKHALSDRLKALGYELTKEELDEVFTHFKALADKKKSLNDADIEALVLSKTKSIEETYKFVSHIVTTGKDTTNIACIKARVGDEIREEVAIGSGPIYAAFKAVDLITGLDVALDDFSLNAVTEGEDAMGEAVVKLIYEGEEFTGRGLSTDVIESSILAYINGINKIVARG